MRIDIGEDVVLVKGLGLLLGDDLAVHIVNEFACKLEGNALRLDWFQGSHWSSHLRLFAI